MLLDIADLEPVATFAADLCVVGGGPAGLSIARELSSSRLRVVVLESGGLELDGETQHLYSGPCRGTLLAGLSGYLATSRLRYLGGASNHWQGWCRRHDALDYEVRDWVLESGWPLELERLGPYYHRASELCRVPDFDDHRDASTLRAALLGEDPDFETTFFHMSPPVRFGEAFGGELAGAPDVRVVLHANVLDLRTDRSRRRVTAVDAASLGGRRLTVRSRGVVLACGGIENARLLLAAGGDGLGLGNERDLVGRYFMDHPSVHLGQLVMPYWRHLMRPYGYLGAGGRRQTVRAALRTSEALQRRERLLNAVFVFDPIGAEEAPELAPEVMALATDVLQLAEGHPDPANGSNFVGALRAEIEQIPDPENRVTLTDERDALGMPRAALRWTIGEQDEASLQGSVRALVRSLGSRLRARVHLPEEIGAIWEASVPSNHHMGTTRMSTTPDRGVVDTDCRVHGIDNLWIAGSSVFPTSGCSNPTLTLIALALRLADHLKELLA